MSSPSRSPTKSPTKTATPSKKVVIIDEPFVETPSKKRLRPEVTIDMNLVNAVDLDCYNYIEAVFNRDTTEDTLDHIKAVNTGMLEDTLALSDKEDYLPTLKRCWIVKLIQTLEALSHIIDESNVADDEAQEKQYFASQLPRFETIADFLKSKCIEESQKAGRSPYISLLVDVRSSIFTCKVGAGRTLSKNYTKSECFELIKEIFEPVEEEVFNMRPTTKKQLILYLSKRSKQHTDEINKREINDEVDFTSLKSRLLDLAKMIFESANQESLPEYHSQTPMKEQQAPKTPLKRLKEADEDTVSETSTHTPVTQRIRTRRIKVFWTEEEDEALKKGIELLGPNWIGILSKFKVLSRRTNVQLKDRARTIRNKLLRDGEDLGVWSLEGPQQ